MAGKKRSTSLSQLLTAFFAGAVAGMLFSPKSGHGTRQWLKDQSAHLSSQSSKMMRDSQNKLKFRAGEAEGLAHKIKDMFIPEKDKYVDDDLIEQRVRTAIGEHSSTSHLPRINVNSEKGTVTLRGPVRKYKDKESLEKVTLRVPDVQEVINRTRLAA